MMLSNTNINVGKWCVSLTSPETYQLHELMHNKSMEEVLLVKSTESLQMDDDSLVEATKSNKSNKIEVTNVSHVISFEIV